MINRMSDISNDILNFQPEDDGVSAICEPETWKVLVVDDEQEIHDLTRLVLQDFRFQGKSLEFFSAYSAKDARELLDEVPGICLILLDVVMEEEDSGLKLVKYIREEKRNSLVRIILRTGQPGQAPEERVIVEYDINDYKSKTELTARKLMTTVISSLRAYNDLMTIEANRRGLEKIIDASASIFELQSMKNFSHGVLTQMTSILRLSRRALYGKTSGMAVSDWPSREFTILAATGEFADFEGQSMSAALPPAVLGDIETARHENRSLFFTNHYVGYFRTRNGSENIVYMEGWKDLEDTEKQLVEVFCTNVSIAYDNLFLNQEIEDTQKDVIYTLGDIIENRSKDTGNHVRRVAAYSEQLALLLGIPENEASRIRMASPMHDLGKLAIPDSILDKPGPLSEQEFEFMKSHPRLGYDMLKTSPRPLLKTAALMAWQHHEKYDGTGYPQGLKGEEIHMYGRITAVADVFDALSTDRVYRKALSLPEIQEYFLQEKGKSFDPVIVDKLLENLDSFLQIGKKLS